MSDTSRDLAQVQRAWLKRVIEETKLTPTALAKRIGVWPSTLTTFLNATKPSRTLHGATLEKIARATGIAGPAALPAIDAPRRPVRGFRDDGEPFKAEAETSVDLQAAIKALIGKRNAADPWTIRTNALEDIGVRAGDIVIVDLGKQAVAGDAVCAQVYDWKGSKAETVFRVYEPPYLVAACRDPSLRKPLAVDNERVIIKGVLLPTRFAA